MLFSSVEFVFVFLPVSLLLYFFSPKKWRNASLLFSSLVFYAWGEPVYLLLMMATIAADWGFGLIIQKDSRRKKLWLTVAATLNLGVLGIFKYLSPAASFLGLSVPAIALPAGISFYTFQALSYVTDIYRGEKAQKNIVDFGTYITMFPQLVAGPIVRYAEVKEPLKERRTDLEKIYKGILRFVTGLSKKLILAGGAGVMWNYFSELPRELLGTLGAWLGIAFYAFQIYFDFSGYSDMAIGLGLFFGFEFPENFNYPYVSTSIRDFWRRWHMSLTAWFREYLYIPLGGNRRGAARTLLNTLAVWAFTGLWHGASLNFLAWGLYYFLLLAVERYFTGRLLKRLPRLICVGYSLFFVLIGWVFFALPSFGEALSYLVRMFSISPSSGMEIYHTVRNIPFLILLSLGATPFPRAAWESLTKKGGARKFALSLCSLFIFALCVAGLVGASYNPFLYFRF